MTSRRAARDKAELAHRLTEEQFCRWVGRADPGDAIEYHRGHLAVDRVREASAFADTDRREIARIADRAMRLAAEDRLMLAQRRLAEGVFSYLAIRPLGRPVPACLHTRLRLVEAR